MKKTSLTERAPGARYAQERLCRGMFPQSRSFKRISYKTKPLIDLALIVALSPKRAKSPATCKNAKILTRARAHKGEAQGILHDIKVKGIFADPICLSLVVSVPSAPARTPSPVVCGWCASSIIHSRRSYNMRPATVKVWVEWIGVRSW